MAKDQEMTDTQKLTSSEAEPGAASLSPDVQRALGTRIRAAYGELVNEPLPDKFKELLDKLAQSEKAGDK